MKLNKRIQLLDCTLRDGGCALEDAAKYKVLPYVFEEKQMGEITRYLMKSKIDIMEIGLVEKSEESKQKYAIYQSIEEVSKKIPKERTDNQMYAVCFRGPDIPLEEIPDWNQSLCDVVRLIVRYSELQKSLDYCKGLAEKGYKVFIQPMVTMRYTDAQINHIIDAANEMNAYAVYMVDSYGYMNSGDIRRLSKQYHNGLKQEIKVGFHAHNNMDSAYSNALAFIECCSDREIILDSCILGMGQGAGNLQTELIVDDLNKNYGKSYDYDSILQCCEIIESFLESNLWGYSVTRLLPAIHKVAYKYSVALREQYGLSFKEINHILAHMPDELRHRYTPENTTALLELLGYDRAVLKET